MKSAVIALLVCSTAAVKLNDAPAFWPGPTWNETFPSAAGLIQTSICETSGIEGVTCGPSDSQLFATGLSGDENLKEDINIKGAPYKFVGATWVPVAVETKYDDLPLCYGSNGPEGKNCKMPNCDGTNGPKDGPVGIKCRRAEPAKIAAHKDDPTGDKPYAVTGNLTPTDTRYAPLHVSDYVQTDAEPNLTAPEKVVDTLNPAFCRTHTTFYAENK